MLLRPHNAAVTGKFVLHGADPPIPSNGTLSTTPPASASVRTTLVNGTVPQLVTIPLKFTLPLLLPHRRTVVGLHTLVTAMQGAVQTKHVAVLVAWTVCARQAGKPRMPASSCAEASTRSPHRPHRV